MGGSSTLPDTVPEGLTFARGRVPSMETWVKAPEGRFGKWFRKKFRVPEWMNGERILIECRSVTVECTVFVNGQKLGWANRRDLPLWVDITDALKPGEENELMILSRGGIALVRPDYVDQFDPSNDTASRDNQNAVGNTHYPPSLNSVYLWAMPTVRVKQNLVLSDVEAGTIKIMTRVESSDGAPRTVTLQYAVDQNGRPVPLALAPQTVTVPAKGLLEVTTTGPAKGLELWSPTQPTMAKLTTTIVGDGKTLDTHAQRFGYRTLRVDGTGFRFNGQPIRLQGGFTHRPHNFYEMEDDIDVSRDDYAAGGIHLYDETGKLHYRSIGHPWAVSWKVLNNTNYWNSYYTYGVESVWEKGSHPAIVGWDLSNESYHYAPYIAGAEGQVRHAELISACATNLLTRFGSDFWFIADGDEDLGGRLHFCSFHYLNHGARFGGFSQRPGTFGHFDGVSHYAPDLFFMGITNGPVAGTVLGMRPDWIYGSVACGDTETFWFYSPGLGVCKNIGDAAASSAATHFWVPRGMWWTKLAMEGYRDMDMAIIGGMYWQSFLGLMSRDVTFALPEQQIRYYAGAQFDRRLNLHDDEFQPGALDFRWELRNPAGRAVRRGRIKAHSTTAFLQRDRIAFTVPDVREPTPFTLVMELQKDGQRKAYEERTLEVWPRLPQHMVGRLSRLPLAVYDPSGTVAPVLQRLGIESMPLMHLDRSSLSAAGRALLIGPEIAASNATAARAALADWISAGGRVLLLHQEHTEFLPSDVTMEKKAWFSQGFLRATNHPALRGLKDMDMQMWNPGHLIARGTIRKPDKGAFMTLVDSGHDGHMAWSELLEMYMGDGSLVACQLLLLETFGTEPMAAELLRRLVGYLDQPVYRQAAKRLAVFGGASEPVLRRLKDVRASYDIVQAEPAKPGVLLVDLSPSNSPPDANKLRAFAVGGGTLILHRARPEHKAWLETLLNRPVQISIQPYQSWADRLALERRDGLLEGVNQIDLYWRSLISGEDPRSTWSVSNGLENERGQVDYLVRAEGLKDELFPGGLATVEVGRGRVILDQIQWEMSEKDMIGGNPLRVISMLLTNLEIERRLPAPKPALPPGVVYEPIDFSAVANRSFRDDKTGDGIGWVDWGPEADLRSFPTGRVTLAGVPYLVPGGDKNAIVLRCLWTPGLDKQPASVAIPVNKSLVAGLLFLHTGGWIFGLEPFATRTVEYTDGTVDVTQLNAANMADWNPGHDDFPDEEGTRTTVAWKGANPQYPVIRAYQTLWVNPHPEKTIKQVVLAAPGTAQKSWRFIAHFGLTAAILPKATPAQAPTQDTSRSMALLQKALKLIEAKKGPEAAKQLEAAIKLDDRNTSAWQALAELRAATDSVADFTAFCRRWSAAVPTSYEAWNMLGRFLEKHGRTEEALAAYRKSLEVEWNQPPTIQAVQRLEKK